MNIEEYAENFNEAPLLLEDLASAALNVEDDEDFRQKAQSYLVAMEEFEDALAERDIERG